MGEIKVERIINGRLAEICYLIHDKDSKECICIDPGYESKRILDFINKNDLEVKYILLTHGHFDHMLSCHEFQKKFNADIYVSKTDSEILYDADKNYANMININSFDRFIVKDFVKDNDELFLLNYNIKCISTPGHTSGGICYYFENEKLLFSGDTLFCSTYGRTDLYSGNFDVLRESIINKLFILPDDVVIYPGHGEDSIMGNEKVYNEILRS